MSDLSDTVSDLPLRVTALSDTSRHCGSGAGVAVAAVGPVILVRYRPGVTGQTARAVHLVAMPDGHVRAAGTVGALCGALLGLDEIEIVNSVQGMPCTMCILNQGIDTAPATEPPAGNPDSEGTRLINGAAYQAWGWPVTQHHDQTQLSLDCDVSAIAIPIVHSTEITELLTARYCAPAVLAHPYAPQHRFVLTGERFGAPLPWPPSVYQVTGTLMLPPTMTPCGPITWIQPPRHDSLHLTREIDVFGALRAILSASHR